MDTTASTSVVDTTTTTNATVTNDDLDSKINSVKKIVKLFSNLSSNGKIPNTVPITVTAETYEEMLPWYFNTNANLLNVKRLGRIHTKHMIKQAVDKEVFSIVYNVDEPKYEEVVNVYSKGKKVNKDEDEDENSNVHREFKSFVRELRSDIDDFQRYVTSISNKYYYVPRSTLLTDEEKKLVDRYLPMVKNKNYKGQTADTRYPQDSGELSDILSKKTAKDSEFCIAGSFTHHPGSKPLKWRNVKRLHTGTLTDLRDLPEDHPLEEIVYSLLHHDNGNCSADVPPVNTKQWMWQKPVKLTMVYDASAGDLEEILLPSVEYDMMFKDMFDKEYYLRQTDVFAGKSTSECYSHMCDVMKQVHPVPTLSKYVPTNRCDSTCDSDDQSESESESESEEEKEKEKDEEKEEEEEEKDKKNRDNKGKARERSGLDCLKDILDACEETLAKNEKDEDKKECGIEYTNEIHVPDDPRISSVEIILYCGDHDRKSKFMTFIHAKLVSVLKFGNRDMSTVKYTII